MLIFTSCSSTKKVPAPAALRASGVRARTLEGFARTWASRVEAAQGCHPASELYAGNAVAAARSAAANLPAPLHFVSAGMSVVGPRARIPSYDLTVTTPSAAPYPVAVGTATTGEWWEALNGALGRKAPVANIVRQHDDLVLVALPDSYLRMVQAEFLALGAKQRAKLRFISTSHTVVAPELEGQMIRFDQRFQSAEGAPRGAQASFVQRALLHFVGLVKDNPANMDVSAQRALVFRSLSNASISAARSRVRLSDPEILRWIAEEDPTSERSRYSLLKSYRERGFASEQQRFFNLIDQTRT